MASFEYECKPVRALLGTTRVAMLSAFEVDAASSATARVPIKAPTLGIVTITQPVDKPTRNVDRPKAEERLG
jgi:hypothetical protein